MQNDQDKISTKNFNHNSKKIGTSQPPILMGWWKLNKSTSNSIDDLSGNNHTLMAPENQIHTAKNELKKSMPCLGTSKPVLCTNESFSVVAWVRLDSSLMNGKLVLEENEHALTAVSQDSPTHSAFYLGIRRIQESKSDEATTGLKWNFTVSPIDGSETGALEWLHAHAGSPLDDSVLDKWIMLVGICDIEKQKVSLYVPGINETGVAYIPDEWILWRAEGGLQVGRARWLEQNVDPWPGQVGSVRAFFGILTTEDIKRLYLEDSRMMGKSQLI